MFSLQRQEGTDDLEFGAALFKPHGRNGQVNIPKAIIASPRSGMVDTFTASPATTAGSGLPTTGNVFANRKTPTKVTVEPTK